MAQPTEPQLQLVRDKLANNKAFFRRQCVVSRRMWVIASSATIIGSGLVTVIIGIKPIAWLNISSDASANLALILSAAVTALAAAATKFDFQWTWIIQSATLYKIYSLEDELQYLSASNNLSQEQIDSIFQQLQAVLTDVDLSWMRRRLRDASEGGQSIERKT
jgi:hypothetical protein